MWAAVCGMGRRAGSVKPCFPAPLYGAWIWVRSREKPKSIFPLKTDHPRAGKFRKPHRLDIKTVSGMLGHYSAGFTLDTYAHVTTIAQRQAADVMGNVLSGAF